MTTDQEKIVKQLLDDQDELVLKNGENELLIETDDYTLVITYYLDCEYEYLSQIPSRGSYTFNIFEIYLSDNNTNIEYSVELNDDIQYSIIDNSRVIDWSENNNSQWYYPHDY